jgi:putative ABC transport system permease protein
MLRLAWANLIHRKVRTALSVLAVAIAITLLLVLVGLSHGTLNDVSNRMQSVEAEIIVRDRNFDLGTLSGGKLWEKEIPRFQDLKIDDRPAIWRIMPVFLGRLKLAGQSQNVFGVRPEDFQFFAGSRKIVVGRIFTDVESPDVILDQNIAPPPSSDNKTNADENNLPVMSIIIDQKLAAAADMKVGDTTHYGDLPARIVGIVETGVAGRVFAPINMLRAANGIAAPTAHMFFVKAHPDFNTDQLQTLCEKIERATKRDATLVANYGQIIKANFKTLIIFVNLVSVIALVICFLFILVTVYTSVLERSKEMAVLQSLGAGRKLILSQTIHESLLICSTGALLGIAFTFVARYLIETARPLMTVEIRLSWLLGAVAVGIVGGILSAIYPAYVAWHHDPVEALSFE